MYSPNAGSRSRRRLWRVLLPIMSVALAASSLAQMAVASVPLPVFDTAWGSFGSASGQFKYPLGAATDASGNVYVADANNNRIEKFTAGGSFILAWGSSGTGNGQFNQMYSVATDSTGNVYVPDEWNHRIQKFDSDGNFLAKWGSLGTADGQFNLPLGVALDSADNVYVADYANHRIQKFDSDGNFLGKWGGLGTGNGQFQYPLGIALDGDGNVYVADHYNHRIQKFDSDGTFLAKWGSLGSGNGSFRFPAGLAVDQNANLYVADLNNHRIQIFDSAGTFLAALGTFGSLHGQFYLPYGLATGPGGTLYVADSYNHRVQKFVSDFAPPVIEPHADVVAEAAGPSGASVTYAVPAANDDVDGTVAVECTPPSGALFALGDTTVDCEATDAAGNTGYGSFTVSVVDTTPPTVEDNSDQVVEATGPGGANVPYSAPAALDIVDGPVAVDCSPASGSPFPLGATTVDCLASDVAGNSGQSSFTITVEDTNAPIVAAHAPVYANATGRAGAYVSYFNPTATDAVDGFVVVTCAPPSGSLFAVGDTTVDCQATDNAGNSAQSSFTVHVAGAAEQLGTLTTFVTGIGPGASLQAKASKAQSYLAAGDIGSACATLKALANEAKAQSGKKLTTAQANSIIASANRIRAVLAC